MLKELLKSQIEQGGGIETACKALTTEARSMQSKIIDYYRRTHQKNASKVVTVIMPQIVKFTELGSVLVTHVLMEDTASGVKTIAKETGKIRDYLDPGTVSTVEGLANMAAGFMPQNEIELYKPLYIDAGGDFLKLYLYPNGNITEGQPTIYELGPEALGAALNEL